MSNEQKTNCSLRGKSKIKFVMVPNSVYFDERVSGTQLLIWIALKSHTNNEKNVVFPSNVRIAELARCDECTVRRNLKKLKEFGYIRKAGKAGRVNKWFVFDQSIIAESDIVEETEKDQELPNDSDSPNDNGHDAHNITGMMPEDNGHGAHLSITSEVQPLKEEQEKGTSEKSEVFVSPELSVVPKPMKLNTAPTIPNMVNHSSVRSHPGNEKINPIKIDKPIQPTPEGLYNLLLSKGIIFSDMEKKTKFHMQSVQAIISTYNEGQIRDTLDKRINERRGELWETDKGYDFQHEYIRNKASNKMASLKSLLEREIDGVY